MEARTRRPMFETNGSAAYQAKYQYERESTARPLPTPEVPPRRQAGPRPKQKLQKARLAVSPVAVLGMMAAGLMLVLVLIGYTQLYDASSQVAELQEQIETLQVRNDRLQNQYETSIDLEQVKARALELGMKMPALGQKVNVALQASDKVVIASAGEDNLLVNAWQALVETSRALLAYIR